MVLTNYRIIKVCSGKVLDCSTWIVMNLSACIAMQMKTDSGPHELEVDIGSGAKRV